ncbi:hypothetical protein ACFQHO_09005 [Actinomadura yumaensis]|uniref:hypothetical protein n=1 Tax=Actinomadura yumaensis TaxID=111807 RepID=UPI00360B3DB2
MNPMYLLYAPVAAAFVVFVIYGGLVLPAKEIAESVRDRARGPNPRPRAVRHLRAAARRRRTRRGRPPHRRCPPSRGHRPPHAPYLPKGRRMNNLPAAPPGARRPAPVRRCWWAPAW